MARKIEIDGFIRHATWQIDQIKRRVINGQTIPHTEKVFSIFETHTEWITKGKVGVPVELRVRVCILEDQHQFILHHQVMENKTDDQVTVAMVVEAKARFPTLNVCSFNKGFHTPENQTALKESLALVVPPRKGKLTAPARAIERSMGWKSTDSINAPIMALLTSSAMPLWRWWRETFAASVRSWRSACLIDCGGRQNMATAK